MPNTIATAYSTLVALANHYPKLLLPRSKDDRRSHTIYASDLSPADVAYLLTEGNTEGRTLTFTYELVNLHAIIAYSNNSTLRIIL